MTDFFKVAIRLRPLATPVSKKGVIVSGNECWLASKPNVIYKFDICFDEHVNQDTIHERFTKPLINSLLGGYNCCLLAYGQTGSGKTYTMTGNKTRYGIIQQICSDIMDYTSLNNTYLSISYCEVYKEEITDLLTGISGLKIREDPTNGIFISKIRMENVTSYDELLHWINVGRRRRKTMSTLMNKDSSRSHSIITLYLRDGNAITKLNLVDLAGSENIYKSPLTSSMRASESIKINLSLLTLHKVISTLANRNGSSLVVPYRDSKLTFALKDSLSRNSRTYMIATVNPSIEYNVETAQTLKYSSLARTIESKPRCTHIPMPMSAPIPATVHDIPLKLFESHSTINLPAMTPNVDLMEMSMVSHIPMSEAISSNVLDITKELEMSKLVIEELQSTICKLTHSSNPSLLPSSVTTQHILVAPKPKPKPKVKPKPKAKVTATNQRRFKLVY
jgi:hypothetical protein